MLDFSNKLAPLLSTLLSSLHLIDLSIGMMVAPLIQLVVYICAKNTKQFRHNVRFLIGVMK